VSFGEQSVPVIGDPIKEALLNGGPYQRYPYYAGTLSFNRSKWNTIKLLETNNH
jgi:hypothetical protein